MTALSLIFFLEEFFFFFGTSLFYTTMYLNTTRKHNILHLNFLPIISYIWHILIYIISLKVDFTFSGIYICHSHKMPSSMINGLLYQPSKQIGKSVLSKCKDWVNLKMKTEIIEVKKGLNAIIPPLLTKYFYHFNF